MREVRGRYEVNCSHFCIQESPGLSGLGLANLVDVTLRITEERRALASWISTKVNGGFHFTLSQ